MLNRWSRYCVCTRTVVAWLITTQLLTILLIAAMKGTTGPKYYENLMTLDQADQLEIAEVIQHVSLPDQSIAFSDLGVDGKSG